MPLSLFAKLWKAHEIAARPDGSSLMWVDRHYVQEGSFLAFDQLRARGRDVARPDLTIGVADHYVPTRERRKPILDATISRMLRQLRENCEAHGIELIDLDDPRQGIIHVVGPELGLTLPGLLVVEGDSHTSTHGALGAWAFGIGASEVATVLMTQTLWQQKPRSMLVRFEGKPAHGVGAKDMALALVAKIGADGALGHSIEYAGQAVREMSAEARMTLCNMSIEAGARCGLVSPDATTVEYLRGRPFAPTGEGFERAAHRWLALASDADAVFDREIVIDAREIAPIVTWGTSPEEALPIDGRVPDPAEEADPERASAMRAAIDYMGLRPGMRLVDIPIDRVFIGSCTNGRIEDLRAAASVLAGRRSRVPGLVSPGSSLVKRQAEEEGLDRIFVEAGLEWADAGCSMCVGMNGDRAEAGERCASTTNRNFRGRQGKGARTHLMSPVMAAAAALSGHLADARPLIEGRR